MASGDEEEEDFDLWMRVLDVVAASMGFIISLALNEAFRDTFDLIPISVKNKVANAWIYVIVVVPIVFLILWGIFEGQKAIARSKSTDT